MIVSCDFETYYDRVYSLSRMSETDYILDPRFQTIMCSVKVGKGPSEVFVGREEVARRFAEIDWSKAAMLSHNIRCDGSIMAWRYGIEPAMYLDTLSMARATTHWLLGRSSLAKVSDYLGLPPKGTEVHNMIGRTLESLTVDEIARYSDYCNRDNDNCYDIFTRLRPLFSNDELRLIDLVARMFILPQVKLNPDVLAQNLGQVRADKAAALGRVGHIDPSVFSSQQQFAALLEGMGVDVPRKISPATGNEIFALSKSDRGFKELLMDDSQPIEVQALLAARVNAKSTIEETRSQKLLDLSLKDWPLTPALAGAGFNTLDPELISAMNAHGLPGARGRGWAPVPLKYYGARPGRLSGDGGMNWQNFKRGSLIREAIEAPTGYRVVHRDASQIEARMDAWLAGCTILIDAFAAGRDVYSEFATEVYGKPVTKADKLERFVGKTGILGLGYGCGPPKFRNMLFIGNGGVSHSVTEDEATRVVRYYRRRYSEIPGLWGSCGILLQRVINMSRGITKMRNANTDIGLVGTVIEPGYDALWLPNGMCIAYPNIRYERDAVRGDMQMVYDDPYGGSRKIYGAKCTENICQGLARIVVTDIAVRTYDLTGYHPFLSTHDSLDYCVPESDVEWWDHHLEREFAIRPSWGQTLPLASEGGWGRNLHEAEAGLNQ